MLKPSRNMQGLQEISIITLGNKIYILFITQKPSIAFPDLTTAINNFTERKIIIELKIITENKIITELNVITERKIITEL